MERGVVHNPRAGGARRLVEGVDPAVGAGGADEGARWGHWSMRP